MKREEGLKRALQEKNSQIYIQRSKVNIFCDVCPTHRYNEIPDILCTRHKTSPWHKVQAELFSPKTNRAGVQNAIWTLLNICIQTRHPDHWTKQTNIWFMSVVVELYKLAGITNRHVMRCMLASISVTKCPCTPLTHFIITSGEKLRTMKCLPNCNPGQNSCAKPNLKKKERKKPGQMLTPMLKLMITLRVSETPRDT